MKSLESLCDYKDPCTVVMITSDKCYDNVEWINWGYKESDRLGGKDVYSGSSRCCRINNKIIMYSFFFIAIILLKSQLEEDFMLLVVAIGHLIVLQSRRLSKD